MTNTDAEWTGDLCLTFTNYQTVISVLEVNGEEVYLQCPKMLTIACLDVAPTLKEELMAICMKEIL